MQGGPGGGVQPQQEAGGHTQEGAWGVNGWFVCFLHGRIRNPACKDPYTSQGLQGQRKDSRHAWG